MWACLWPGSLPLNAQQEVPGEAAGIYRLHVYEDLVQLPALVLNTRGQSFPGLQAKDFRVELDSGPPFQPMHARLEGEDPISMALLFDVSGVSTAAMLAGVLPEGHLLPAGFPGKTDELMMYALDCHLARAKLISGTAQGVPALTQQLMQTPGLHADEGAATCARPVRLWDALALIGKQLSGRSGRRVLVVVTDGKDNGSRNSWEAVRQYLGGYGIALFAVRPVAMLHLSAAETSGLVVPATPEREDRLALLAGGTGGLVMSTNEPNLADLLTRTVSLLRKRYILEFHRPRNGTAGVHQIEVQVSDFLHALIRTSGVTVPLRVAQAGEEGSAVPRDDSRDPVIGTRRVLTPSH